MARVTGIGGVFFRAKDPKALEAWYAKHLGIAMADWGGAMFLWTDEVPATTGMTTWAAQPVNSSHIGPGPQTAMINYRVDDLDALVEQLEAAGVAVEPKRESFEYGKFAWMSDPEGNRLELWEPIADTPEVAP